MAVKEPGWIFKAPGKKKVEIKGENGDDNRERIETQNIFKTLLSHSVAISFTAISFTPLDTQLRCCLPNQHVHLLFHTAYYLMY